MANIPALVTVNGVELPEPSSYEGTTSTIVTPGEMFKARLLALSSGMMWPRCHFLGTISPHDSGLTY